jgi:hypothetical protein
MKFDPAKLAHGFFLVALTTTQPRDGFLFASPFKSKSRLEAEESGAPTLADHIAAKDARSCPPHEWGSLVLSPAVSMVSIGAEDHHDRPARDPRSLAPRRLPPVLAVEIPLPWRPTATRRGSARADQADEHGKSTVGLRRASMAQFSHLQRTSVGVDNAIAVANINAF